MPPHQTALQNQSSRERRRRRFRPPSYQFLFIGEAPPASGKFFYNRDSGLYRAIRETFQTIDPSINDTNFLTTFQSAGCYLIDLCPQPVDQLPTADRRAACIAAESALARTIARFQPHHIVTVVRSIEPNVLRAASLANWHGPFLHLPYPGRWSRYKNRFVLELAPYLTNTASFLSAPHPTQRVPTDATPRRLR